MSLSDDIKMTRQKAFLSQEQFADEIHSSTASINRWENGRGRPNLSAMKNIKAFCEKYNLSFDLIEKDWFNYSMEEKND